MLAFLSTNTGRKFRCPRHGAAATTSFRGSTVNGRSAAAHNAMWWCPCRPIQKLGRPWSSGTTGSRNGSHKVYNGKHNNSCHIISTHSKVIRLTNNSATRSTRLGLEYCPKQLVSHSFLAKLLAVGC